MKKILFALILTAIAFNASRALADWTGEKISSGQVMVAKITAPAAASAAAVTGRAAFYGIIVKTDGINNVTLNIYDNTAASGTKLIPTDTVISGTERTWTLSYTPAVGCTIGVYVSISVAGGGSAVYQVEYDQ